MGQSNWKHTRNWTSFRYRDTDAEVANMAHSTQILAVLCVTTLLAVVLGLPAENLPRSSDSFDPETDDDIPADVYINHEEMTAWMQPWPYATRNWPVSNRWANLCRVAICGPWS